MILYKFAKRFLTSNLAELLAVVSVEELRKIHLYLYKLNFEQYFYDRKNFMNFNFMRIN